MESALLMVLGVWVAVLVVPRTGLPGILILTMCCLALRLTPLCDDDDVKKVGEGVCRRWLDGIQNKKRRSTCENLS